jgi:hypothetical protein
VGASIVTGSPAAAVAHKYVYNRRAAGHAPAAWVMEGPGEPRAAPIEVLEAGLLRARDQFEEKKLDHLGHLIGWLFFQDSLSASDAQHFLALAASLRYRQLVLVSLLADEDCRTGVPDKQWEGSVMWKDMGLKMETAQLVNEGILLHEGGIHGPGSFANINPARLTVLMQGSVLHEGMDLRSVSASDRTDLLYQLQQVNVVVVSRDES